jgi:hypothetical protein
LVYKGGGKFKYIYLISPKKRLQRLQRCFIRVFGGYKAATKWLQNIMALQLKSFVKRLTILSGETITGVYDIEEFLTRRVTKRNLLSWI